MQPFVSENAFNPSMTVVSAHPLDPTGITHERLSSVTPTLPQVVMTRLTGIFATGLVSAQHTNYVLCMEFLERLSGIGGEEKRPRIRQRLLRQDSVVEFKARWNLPIYFQLRQALFSSITVFSLFPAILQSRTHFLLHEFAV